MPHWLSEDLFLRGRGVDNSKSWGARHVKISFQGNNGDLLKWVRRRRWWKYPPAFLISGENHRQALAVH